MTAPWWDGLPPAATTVECSGRRHRLRWRDGELSAADHEDVAGERTLAALAGQRYHCIDLLDAWQRHRADLDVLVLAGRGPGDVLRWSPDDPALSVRGPAVITPETELPLLLTLGGGLPDRLVATVIAERARRLPDEPGESDEPGDDADARLPAALYGRAAAAVRAWLGQPDLSVDVEMIGATSPPSLCADGERLRLDLPFAWLGDVWARDLATIMGRFTLSATGIGNGQWSLLTVGPGEEHPRTITIRLAPE